MMTMLIVMAIGVDNRHRIAIDQLVADAIDVVMQKRQIEIMLINILVNFVMPENIGDRP